MHTVCMTKMNGQDTDLRGGGESMGPLRPATPDERMEARERVWEAAERWRYRNRRTHLRKRVYYQEVCMALGIMDIEEGDADWREWNRWVLIDKGRRYTSPTSARREAQ